MDLRAQIAHAWHITQTIPKLRWFAFLPALVSTLVGVVWLMYQYSVMAPYFGLDTSGLIDPVMDFAYHNGSWTVAFVVVAVIVLLTYFTLPILFQGGLIAMIDNYTQSKKYGFFYGLSQGLTAYPPMFEYHTLISPLSVISVFSLTALMIRNGLEDFWPLSLLLLILSFVAGFFFSYTDFFIVLKRRSIFEAMSKSVKMVMLHLPETALMAVLMIIIGLRIIINILLILFIPLVIILGTAYLSTLALGFYGIVLAVVVATVLIFLTSYFNALINVFTAAVWTLTFNVLYLESAEIIDPPDDDD